MLMMTVSLLVGAGASFYFIGRAVTWALSRRTSYILAITSAFPAVLYAAFYLHFYDGIWFYNIRSLPLTEYLPSLLGISLGVLSQKISGPKLPTAFVLLALMTGVLAVPYFKPLFRPVDYAALSNQWDDDICLQSSGSTCGPSCAATMLRLGDKSATERELAQECFSSTTGTENWYLVRALRARGLKVECVQLAEDPPELIFPAVAGVQIGSAGGAGHYICILGRIDGRYIIGDPMRRKYRSNREDLRKRYYFTGFFMTAAKRD
jgi:hypothetical protein